MMDPQTREVVTSIRDSVLAINGEMAALIEHISAVLGDPVGEDQTDQIAALQAQIAELEATVANREEQITSLGVTISDITTAFDATIADRDRLSDNLVVCNATGAALNDELTACNTALDVCNANLFAANARIGVLVARIAELEGEEPPPPPPIDGLKWSLPKGQPTGQIWNIEDAFREIRTRLTGDPNFGWPDGYVNETQGIEFTSEGGVIMHMDPARRLNDPNTGGANWTNAATLLEYPGTDVEIRYRVTCPHDFGKSMKLIGLCTVTGDQRAPGGGYTGAGQFIARPCISDYNRDDVARSGPYVYWPYEIAKGAEQVNPVNKVELWHPDFSGYSLLWYGHPDAIHRVNDVFDVSLRVQRQDDGRWLVMQQVGGHLITYTYANHPNNPEAVTHLAWNVMYGGNDRSYGPDEPTVVRLDGIEVITRA